MQHGHLDHEREHVINKGIESLVDHSVDRNMGHTLELIVNEQLGRHRDESCVSAASPNPTEQINEVGERGDDPVVPGLVGFVDQRVDGVSGHQRIQNHHQVLHRDVVVLLRLARAVRRAVADAEHRPVPLPVEADLHRLGDLPQLRVSPLREARPR